MEVKDEPEAIIGLIGALLARLLFVISRRDFMDKAHPLGGHEGKFNNLPKLVVLKGGKDANESPEWRA